MAKPAPPAGKISPRGRRIADRSGDLPSGAGERFGAHRRSSKVSEIVARELLEYILHEDLPPGTKLPSEAAMLTSFDVGRASLREALRILEVYGLISVRPGPGGGPVVEAVGPEELARLLMFYLNVKGITYGDLQRSSRLLHAVMAGDAARRQDRRQIRAMRKALKEAENASGDLEFGAAIHTFRNLLFVAPGGEFLGLIYDALHQIIILRIRRRISVEDARAGLEGNRRILEAIEAGRVEDAARLAGEHLQHVDALYEKVLPGFLGETIAWA